MKKFKIFERIRKPSPNPLKFLRLNRAEFGSTFKKSNYDFENYYPDIGPLLKSVSGFYKINKESIYLGAGGESIIKDIFLLMFLKKKKISYLILQIFLCISIIQIYLILKKQNILHL